MSTGQFGYGGVPGSHWESFFFWAITSFKRIAAKEDRKRERFQITQNTPETRNISRSRIEHVYLKASYTMNDRKNPDINTLTELHVFLNQVNFIKLIHLLFILGEGPHRLQSPQTSIVFLRGERYSCVICLIQKRRFLGRGTRVRSLRRFPPDHPVMCAGLQQVFFTMMCVAHKSFFYGREKLNPCMSSTRGYLFVCRGKKGKPTASCTPVRSLWVQMRDVIPVGIHLRHVHQSIDFGCKGVM